MISIDTNILLRFLLDDHPALSAQARRIIGTQHCHVGLLTLAETGFVLVSFYRASKTELVRSARALLDVPTLAFEREERLPAALDAVASGMDWFDALLWAGSPTDQPLASFDRDFVRRAAKMGLPPRVELLLPAQA